MLTVERRQAASDLLYAQWRAGTLIDSLPAELLPKTRADAYGVQALLEGRDMGALVGWKIAATSLAGQKHIGVDGPLAGRILAGTVIPHGAKCTLAKVHMKFAEAEFVFRMARDLPPRATPYTHDEVMAAVAALHVGIEIPDSRFTNYTSNGPLQLICDNSCAHAFFLGPACAARWRDVDLSGQATVGRVLGADGTAKLEWPGSGGNVLGDPRTALIWLANELAAYGVTLRAGQFVTTGTCVPPMPVAPGDTFWADFGELGKASLAFD